MSVWAIQIIGYVPGETGRQWLDTLSSCWGALVSLASRYPCIVLPMIWLFFWIVGTVLLAGACSAIQRWTIHTPPQSQAKECVQGTTPPQDGPNVPGP